MPSKCPQPSSLQMAHSKMCEYSGFKHLHHEIKMFSPSWEWRCGSWRQERKPSEKPHMMDGKLLQIISWGDKTMSLLYLCCPSTYRTYTGLPLPVTVVAWFTTLVTAFPHVWGLRWPLFLLTCCEKASCVLTACSIYQSLPCFGSQEARVRTHSHVSPWRLSCIFHMRSYQVVHVITFNQPSKTHFSPKQLKRRKGKIFRITS